MKEGINSYTELIKPEDLEKYTIIDNWEVFFQKELNLKKSIYGDNIPWLSGFYFKNLIILSNVILQEEYPCKISFENCYFKIDLRFVRSKCTQHVNINTCYIDRDFSTGGDGCIFEKNLQIINLSVGKSFNIVNGKFNKCVWSFQDKAKITIEEAKFDYLEISPWKNSNYSIDTLDIDFKNTTGNVTIKGGGYSSIESLRIAEGSEDVDLVLENISVNSLYVERFRNSKTLKFLNVRAHEIENKNTQFLIQNSYLGNAEFYNIDFTKFDVLGFPDSHLVDCTFVNIIWSYDFREYFVVKIGDKFNPYSQITVGKPLIRVPSKQREVYRQLKYAMSKQGDTVNEQMFHSLEMQAYRKRIRWKDNWQNKLVVELSYLTSDFGQSLIRPFLSLLIFHWLLFAILLLTREYTITFSIQNPNWHDFNIAFGDYLLLLNPLRKADIDFKGYIVLIDILMRIWSSYMIYNFVRATRRFIK